MKKAVSLLLMLLVGSIVFAQTYENNYSHWNAKRPTRATTRLIVLHTTEGKDKSALSCVRGQGTCNYLITTDGVIHRIIHHTRIAKHAGRSMWNGRTNLSNSSIGIEVVGWHNKKPTDKQLAALKSLLAILKKTYKLSDKSVVTHSMVAYGAPDKWHSRSHRGRKRCAMLFATSEIRKKIGLSNTFSSDPDVQAKRLVVADPYLQSILYGSSVQVKEPDDEKTTTVITEDVCVDDDETFEGFQEIDSRGVYAIAGEEFDSSSTIYFLPDGKIRTGAELSKKQLNALVKGTKILVGYVYGGKITKSRTAYNVVGRAWNYPSTYYRFPDGTVRTGDDVDGKNLPVNTIVLFRK